MTASEQDELTTAGILAAREAAASSRLDGETFSVGAPVPDVNTPRCRTADKDGRDICDQPARYVVWGHLYEKNDKGPKCAKHLPHITPNITGPFGPPAIYEIPDAAELSRLRGVVEEVRTVAEDAIRNVTASHSHWDFTMQGGAGCGTCISSREQRHTLERRLDAALSGGEGA